MNNLSLSYSKSHTLLCTTTASAAAAASSIGAVVTLGSFLSGSDTRVSEAVFLQALCLYDLQTAGTLRPLWVATREPLLFLGSGRLLLSRWFLGLTAHCHGIRTPATAIATATFGAAAVACRTFVAVAAVATGGPHPLRGAHGTAAVVRLHDFIRIRIGQCRQVLLVIFSWGCTHQQSGRQVSKQARKQAGTQHASNRSDLCQCPQLVAADDACYLSMYEAD